MLYPGGTGNANRTETVETEVELDSPGGTATGNMTTTTTIGGNASAQVSSQYFSGTASAGINLEIKETIQGDHGSAGANLTETRAENGTSFYQHDIHYGSYPANRDKLRVDDKREYSVTNTLVGETLTLQAVGGKDERTLYVEQTYAGPPNPTTTIRTDRWTKTRAVGANNTIIETPTHTWTLSITDLNTNQTQNYDNNHLPPPPPTNGDWLSNASNFMAGMSDALTCGLTQRFRSALGYDDVVNQNSAFYTGGQISGTVLALAIPNPCGKAALMKGAINGFRVAQGAGSAINAAEAAQNGDLGGMLLHGAGAGFAFGRFNACFAAGTAIRTPDGSKRIEDLRVGDLVLTRDEHHPDSAVVARPVVGTLENTTQILRLIVGEREIRTSAEHPFFVKDRGWRPAKLIQPGDELLTEAGTWTKCKAAVLTADFEPVYNVEIEEHHTYFVGEAADGSAIWAHNACHLNNNLARSKFGIYEIRVKGQLHKVGKVDMNRVTQDTGLPTRLHQQLRKLRNVHGANNVRGSVVDELGQTTTKAAKLAERLRLQDIFEQTGMVPPGNVRSFFPLIQ